MTQKRVVEIIPKFPEVFDTDLDSNKEQQEPVKKDKRIASAEEKVTKYPKVVDIGSEDSHDNNEEQEALRKVKSMTKEHP